MTEYLESQVMTATASCMALASLIIGFDIVELWHEDASGKLHCTYVHCVEKLKRLYPDIISGYFPKHQKEHKISPRLCTFAKQSRERYYWRIDEAAESEEDEEETSLDKNVTVHPSKWHALISAPIKTEVAYHLEGQTDGLNVFIIGFAVRRIAYMDSKIKFLSGLGYAIYIAAFDLDEDESSLLPSTMDSQLDVQLPRPIVKSSSSGLNLSVSRHSSYAQSAVAAAVAVASSMPAGQTISQEVLVAAASAPSWPPFDSFSFPVIRIPVVDQVPFDLSMDLFREVKHIADGSNSNIYLVKWKGQQVIVKMIKASVAGEEVANQEFDVEHGILCRLNHPNIIKLLGAGSQPRRFLVLEYLGGGSLNSRLTKNQNKPGLASRLFRRPLFTYTMLLHQAKCLAGALDYLHTGLCSGAMIIHRDLKPDNVGFTADNQLKLFDFGLCSIVKTREQPTDKYEMTGNTGSLRYMAPEVASHQPYCESVDVYSYAIMVWQMARDKVPFKGFTKDEFMQKVVRNHHRPKLDKNWPEGFSSLLTQCWDKDPLSRPTFKAVIGLLTDLEKVESKKSAGVTSPVKLMTSSVKR